MKRGEKTVRVIQWIGISMDEMQRMKPSRYPFCEHRWPLIELRMSRHACLEWMQRGNYPKPPRSACVFCPYHSNNEWRRLRDEEPEQFARAVAFEKRIQAAAASDEVTNSIPYLHASRVPLDQVDLRTDEERGQTMMQWQDECEGMCGV